MNVIVGHDEAVADWAGKRLGRPFTPPYVAIGFSRDGERLHGAAVFNGWNGANIDLTIYGPGCLTRGAIRAVYDYAFRQIGAARMTARTARTNKPMKRLIPRLGFEYEGVAKRYYGPERKDDAIVFGLFPERAKDWIGA